MVLHGSCVFCELFFRSSSFPARVRAQVHVRSDLDALPFAPFSFRAPFPPFPLFGSFWGYPFRLVSGLPPVRHSPGLGEGCTVHFLESSSFPPSSSLRLARALSGGHVSGTPQVRPQSLLHRAPPPGYFCLLSFAARPTVRASVLPSAWPRLRLRHQRPHSMGFSIAPGSAQSLPWSLCRLPDRHGFCPGWLPFKRRGNWSAWRNHYGRKHPSPPRVGLLGRRPGLPDPSAAQAPAPPGVTAWSDPTDEQAVRQLISAEIIRHRRRSPWSARSWLEKTQCVLLLR